MTTLNAKAFIQLEAALVELIHHKDDRVLFIDMGPAEGRGRVSLQGLGRQAHVPARGPVVW